MSRCFWREYALFLVYFGAYEGKGRRLAALQGVLTRFAVALPNATRKKVSLLGHADDKGVCVVWTHGNAFGV